LQNLQFLQIIKNLLANFAKSVILHIFAPIKGMIMREARTIIQFLLNLIQFFEFTNSILNFQFLN